MYIHTYVRTTYIHTYQCATTECSVCAVYSIYVRTHQCMYMCVCVYSLEYVLYTRFDCFFRSLSVCVQVFS